MSMDFLNKTKEKSETFSKLQKRDFEVLFKKGLVKNICPVCSCDSHKPEFDYFNLKYIRCLKCKTIYPLKYFADKDLLDYYRYGESINYFIEHILAPSVATRKSTIYPDRVKLIEKFKKGGKILEVGCARGDFLTCLDRRYWEVFGVEINKMAIKHAREINKIEVFDGEITDESLLNPDITFDVIVIWEVLPFVNMPHEIVKRCFNLLSPSGLLLIGQPNSNSLEYWLLGKKSHFINCFNRNIFNVQNTLLMLENLKYRLLDATNIGFEIVSFMYKVSGNKMSIISKLANKPQKILNSINYGNLMRICIQKQINGCHE